MNEERIAKCRVQYQLALEDMIACGQLPLTPENGVTFRAACESFRIIKNTLINLENKE